MGLLKNLYLIYPLPSTFVAKSRVGRNLSLNSASLSVVNWTIGTLFNDELLLRKPGGGRMNYFLESITLQAQQTEIFLTGLDIMHMIL